MAAALLKASAGSRDGQETVACGGNAVPPGVNLKDERLAVMGAFKTPTLRNVALTPPYFHNGGQATLQQVMAFYNRGGDFNNINKSVTIWLWNDYQTTLLKVLFFTVLVSVIFTILIGTAFRTLRQIREIRARSRSQKLEEEIREMKEKASMLQTRPAGGSTTTPVSASLADIATPIDTSPPPPKP